MASKPFPMDLSKFKKVSTDKNITTLRHPSGHEIRIAHNSLSPKLRGHLAELPDHEEASKDEKMADGGKVSPTPVPGPDKKKAEEFVKGATQSGWQPDKWIKNAKEGLGLAKGGKIPSKEAAAPDQTPQAMIENPHYQEGGPMPRYMTQQVAEDTKGLEQPLVDPISLAATGVTAGIGPMVSIAAKNAASNAVKDVGKQAISSNIKQVGQNTGYTPTSAPVNYQKQMIEGVRALPKKTFYKDGGEVSEEGPNNPKLAESKKSPRMYAEGDIVDPNDVTEQAITQQPTIEALPAVDPSVSRKRELYNTLAPTNWRIDETGNTPRLDPLSWQRAEELFNQEQQAQVQHNQQQVVDAQGENTARQAAGLPPIQAPIAPAQLPQVGHPAPNAETPKASPSVTQGSSPQFSPTQPISQIEGERLPDASSILQKGIDESKLGLMREAAALGAQAHAEDAALKESIARRQEAESSYQEQFNTLNGEREAFQHDLNEKHIDPDRLWNEKSTLSKVSTSIGLILGGMGGGLMHQENPALKFLNAQIDRDIAAQQADLGKAENLLSANIRQFGNLKDATEMTRMMQQDAISMQLKQAAAQAQDPLAKARALQAAGKIDMDTSQLQGQMAMRRTLTNAQALAQKDPSQMGKYIALLAQVDPKQAEDLREREVPGIGFANTQADAKELKEGKAGLDNGIQGIKRLKEINKISGKSLSPSLRAEAQTIQQTLVGLLRLPITGPGAMNEGERKMLEGIITNPTSMFQLDSSNKIRLETLQKKLEQGYKNMVESKGLAMPNPINKLNPQQKAFVEWAKKNPQDPKSALVLQKLGIE